MQTKLFFSILITFIFLTSTVSIAAEPPNESEAKTNFDHIKLAEYYENEAKEMSAKAEEHRKMLDEYKNNSHHYGREGQVFQSHHEALIRKYEKAAERNSQMALSHRNMSRKVKGL